MVCGIMLFGLSDIPANAAAWSQQKGKGLGILTYRYYGTDKAFTENGTLVKNDNNGTFRQHELNLYVEYGLPKNITLIGNFFLQNVTSSDDVNGSHSTSGLSQQEIGARWQFSHSPAQALQFIFAFPGGYSMNDNPVLGNNQLDFELLYFIGDSFQCFNRKAFWELGGGVRFRTGAPADQLRWFGTLGYSFNKNWDVYAQLEGTHGLGNGSTQNVGNNITLTTDYTLLKATLNVAYNFNDRWTLSAGPFINYYGKNTGGGGGVQASVWYRF